MGKSPSIQDLEAKDNAFRDYLSNLEKQLDAQAAAAKTAMEAAITDFYTKNKYDDAKEFVSGQNTDFVHTKEFSLQNVKNIIDAISAAVFAGSAVPSGASVNKDAVQAADKALGKEVGAMANLELYIAGKVFDVLSNVILSFGSSTQMSYTSSTKSESLGFGMQLFTSVAASSYQSQSFFNNEFINQYLYMYDVRFSVAQAQEEAAMGIVQAYENQLATFEDLLNKLADQLDQGAITLDQYTTTSQAYEDFIDKYKAKIDALKTDPALAVHA